MAKIPFIQAEVAVKDKTVYFRVNAQTVRNFDDFTASNDMIVMACEEPEINEDTIYVRGSNKNMDESVAQYECSTVKDAKALAKRISEAIEDFNDKEGKSTDYDDLEWETIG